MLTFLLLSLRPVSRVLKICWKLTSRKTIFHQIFRDLNLNSLLTSTEKYLKKIENTFTFNSCITMSCLTSCGGKWCLKCEIFPLLIILRWVTSIYELLLGAGWSRRPSLSRPLIGQEISVRASDWLMMAVTRDRPQRAHYISLPRQQMVLTSSQMKHSPPDKSRNTNDVQSK